MQASRSHRATITVFVISSLLFLFAYAALENWLDNTRAADSLEYRYPAVLLFLTGPSMFFALAVLAAVVICNVLIFFERPYSTVRILSGIALLVPIFPIGFYLIMFLLFAPLSIFGDKHSSGDPEALNRRLFQLLLVTAILLVGGAFCVLAAALASRVITGQRPAFALRWSIFIPFITLILSAAAQSVWWKIHFADINPFRYFFGMPLDLFIGGIGRLQFIFLFGVPMLAAAIGHWLHLASRRRSAATA